MRLTDLLPDSGSLPDSFQDIDIAGLSSDSREVRPGWLFAALKGVRHDGRDYIAEAINNGAVAVLTADNVPEIPDINDDIAVIRTARPRRMLSLIAARFYQSQPDYIAAVTGTNGKTSTVHFARQIWKAMDMSAASLGTLGVKGGGKNTSGSLTTPDPIRLHAELADLAAAGVTHLALEASSHGLHQNRLDGVRVTAAGFTNFSHDHLDYHKTMDDYLQAKAHLFSDILKPGGTAVLNADIPEYGELLASIENRDIDVLSYGYNGDDIILNKLAARPGGQTVNLSILGQSLSVVVPLVGAFQVMNILCAVGLVLAVADDREAVISTLKYCLPEMRGAPGRLEYTGSYNDGAVYVDYAHTPDALEHVLKALRPHTKGRLICLFGCGGDRDARKRPLMGRVAATYADIVVVTDDNPRHEDPAAIRQEILTGMKGTGDYRDIADRRAAIAAGVETLEAGDILLVAGKGHETGQIIKGDIVPHNDSEEINKAIDTFTA